MNLIENSHISFRCTKCDYDLRGLAGSVVRCPECGIVNEPSNYLSHLKNKATASARQAVDAVLWSFLGFFVCASLYPSALSGVFALFFVWLWYHNLRPVSCCLSWSPLAFWNLVELHISIAATIATGLLGVLGCLVAPVIAYGLKETLSPSAPFREPISLIIALVALFVSPFVAFRALLFVARWSSFSFQRLGRQCFSHLREGA